MYVLVYVSGCISVCMNVCAAGVVFDPNVGLWYEVSVQGSSAERGKDGKTELKRAPRDRS